MDLGVQIVILDLEKLRMLNESEEVVAKATRPPCEQQDPLFFASTPGVLGYGQKANPARGSCSPGCYDTEDAKKRADGTYEAEVMKSIEGGTYEAEVMKSIEGGTYEA